MNNSIKTLIFAISLSFSSTFSFSYCFKYMEGTVGGKYPIIVKRNNDRDSIEYMYQSQLKSQNYIRLETLSDHMVEVVNGKRTKNTVKLTAQTKDFGMGVWKNGSKGTEFSFEYGLNTSNYIKVNEYQDASNTIEIYRRQIGQNEFILAISINGSEIVPFVMSDCSRPFYDTIQATLINAEHGLWKLSADSISMGGGNFYLSVTALVKVKSKPKLLAWSSRESGGSGVSYRESINSDYSISNRHLVYSVEQEVYESSQEKTEINTVRKDYKYELDNITKPVIGVEQKITVINQETTFNETKEFEIGSEYPSLLEETAEGYPGHFYF